MMYFLDIINLNSYTVIIFIDWTKHRQEKSLGFFCVFLIRTPCILSSLKGLYNLNITNGSRTFVEQNSCGTLCEGESMLVYVWIINS